MSDIRDRLAERSGLTREEVDLIAGAHVAAALFTEIVEALVTELEKSRFSMVDLRAGAAREE